MKIKSDWWKILGVVLVLFSLFQGLMGRVPVLPILHETIRNIYYHVPMWFAMVILFVFNAVYSIKYLSSGNEHHDNIAVEAANVGLFLGVLGLLTGMLWAKYTWGEAWSNDPKQNSAAIGMLVYLAYFVLRGSLDEAQKRAKISAVYSVFAFPVMIVLLFILPRLTDSLHPGNGGNPGFNKYDMDNQMRMVFYPAVIGWILMGVWVMQIRVRLLEITNQILEN